jgi:hypothetical protein
LCNNTLARTDLLQIQQRECIAMLRSNIWRILHHHVDRKNTQLQLVTILQQLQFLSCRILHHVLQADNNSLLPLVFCHCRRELPLDGLDLKAL